MNRAQALQARETLGDSLFYLTKVPGWVDFTKIVQEHIDRYQKSAENPRNGDEARLRAMSKALAIKDLLKDVDVRISEGTEAKKILTK